MIRSHERDKLIEATVFFATHTLNCGKIKLIKLLYLLDFEHFRQTGRSVTGLEYRAWKMGPVPPALFAEWEQLEPDFSEAVQICPEQVFDYFRERVVPRRNFSDAHFSRRELRLMDQLARKFREELSRPLINFTHRELGPWAMIWDDGRGNQERIPYRLALSDADTDREVILAAASDWQRIRAALQTTG